MEQHAVPRNITGFQFRLIGDMTVRQFGYLAAGVISAFLIYKIGPFPGVVKAALSGMFGLSGFAFAFLPIQERPLDVWLLAFIKSINSPTQYLWKKDSVPPDILTRPSVVRVKIAPVVHIQAHYEAKEKLQAYLKTLPSQPHQTLNVQEKNYIDKTLALFNTTSYKAPPTIASAPYIKKAVLTSLPQVNTPLKSNIRTNPPVISPKPTFIPTPEKIPQLITDEAKTASLNPPIKSDAIKIPTPQTVPFSPSVRPAIDYNKLQNQLSGLTSDKENLLKELQALKEELKRIQQPNIISPTTSAEEKKATIKTVTPKEAVDEVGLPNLPQTPNIVIGVIKDPQRRILPNIILTIKDPKGLPIRALKTNKLGQFATATPLPNGTYLLEIEDPLKRFVFDIAQITLSGKIFLPIEIFAKGEKEMIREKLTKELFGSANL